ncbi:MAG: NfeD family protein [Isosphaeraceae bacterium]
MTWVVVLLVAGFAFLMAEAVLPSGGLLFVLAAVCLGLSLFEAFRISTSLGLTLLVLDLILTPTALVLGLYLWQKSPLAAKMTLRRPTAEELDPAADPHPAYPLAGALGRTLTPLRPTGYVEIAGTRMEGLSQEGFIPANASVVVVSGRGARLVVRESRAGGPEPPEDRTHSRQAETGSAG